ncbi:MAG TPA: glycosyltransferase family 4 protein [Vicinamibacterales bacterium]|jgi:glycosyltransferase involved in cell wall biosynthesis
MRIALVTSYMPPHLGGIETIAQHLFDGYTARGHQVRWLTSRVPRGLPEREGTIVRTACLNFAEDWFGIPVPIWGPGAIRELRALVEWADGVHVLECLYVTSALAVAASRARRRPVLLSQNIGFIPYKRAWVRALEQIAYQTIGRAVLRGASHVVLATPTAEAWVRGMFGGQAPRWTSSFPIGIDTEDLRPPTASARAAARAALGVAGDRPVALFAGRLVEKKSVPLVIAAASLATEFDVLVAGDGPLRGLLRHVSPNLRWLGSVDARAMRDLYAAADLVLLPSRGEGLPLVVQEAMSCALPCVVSDDEVYVEPLRIAGACVTSARTPTALHAAMRHALDCRATLGAAARVFAEANWTRDVMIARCEALFETLG